MESYGSSPRLREDTTYSEKLLETTPQPTDESSCCLTSVKIGNFLIVGGALALILGGLALSGQFYPNVNVIGQIGSTFGELGTYITLASGLVVAVSGIAVRCCCAGRCATSPQSQSTTKSSRVEEDDDIDESILTKKPTTKKEEQAAKFGSLSDDEEELPAQKPQPTTPPVSIPAPRTQGIALTGMASSTIPPKPNSSSTKQKPSPVSSHPAQGIPLTGMVEPSKRPTSPTLPSGPGTPPSERQKKVATDKYMPPRPNSGSLASMLVSQKATTTPPPKPMPQSTAPAVESVKLRPISTNKSETGLGASKPSESVTVVSYDRRQVTKPLDDKSTF